MHCMPAARFRRIALAGCALLGACNDTSDLAPASPDTPWQFEASKEAPAPPAPTAAARRFAVPENTAVQLPSPADVDSNHVYSLVELIDVAQRRNPSTRVAWEQGGQAAINVGIARAAYLPALTASAVTGWEHFVTPFPSNLVPQGFIIFNAQEAIPQLAVNYLLLDFGGRAAAVEAAGQLSIAGNVAFTAAHQQLIFNVARAYFTLDGADAAVRAAQQGLADARAVRAWSTCCAVTKPCPSSGCRRPSVLEASARCASALPMPRSAAPALEVCAATWSAVSPSFASRPCTAARAWSTRIR